MDIHGQYTSEIQHEIALLKTGKANYAIRANCRSYLKFWTTLHESMSHGKTMATTVEYVDEKYYHAWTVIIMATGKKYSARSRARTHSS